MTPERLIIESMFRIPNKEGKDIDFILNDVQADLDTNRTLRNIIPKARQRGISTYITGLFLASCLSTRNRRCVVVSHSTDATAKLLGKAHYILRNLRDGVEASLRYDSRNELYFSETDSIFYVGTAGNANVGVGDTITHLHCSEPALWPNPVPLLKGLFNAVPTHTGTVFIEGTGNGMGNWYHRQCMRAADGAGQYKLHFYSWTDAEEYRTPVRNPAAFLESLDEDEAKLYENKVLDLEQLQWRRDKIEEMDFDTRKFKEQYPLSLEECFQGAGASFFQKVNYTQSGQWRRREDVPHAYGLGGHPHPTQHYYAGVDVGAGAGQDNTVLEVFSVEENRQVFEWASNIYEPDRAAALHAAILKGFNNPYTNVERNNQGTLYIKELLNHYPHTSVHMSKPPKNINEYGKIYDYGTFTSQKSRPEIIGSLRKEIAQEVQIHSPLLKAEMDSFVENERGKLEAQEGCLDDRVMAAAMATYVLPKVRARLGFQSAIADRGPPSPFQLEGILADLEAQFERRQNEL